MSKRKMPLEIKMEINNHSYGTPSKQMKMCTENNDLNDSCIDQLLNGVDFNETMGAGLSPFKSATRMIDVDNLLNGVNFNESYNHNSERESLLDLSEWKRCIVEVIEYEPKTFSLILFGHEETTSDDECVANGSRKPFKCYLQDAWSHCKLKENGLVSILAEWNDEKNGYCISSKSGFIIIYPDLLISGTAVVGGLFCLRKAILSDRFKGIDFNNKIMTIGSIIHELFQIVLRRKLSSLSEIQKVSDELLASKDTAFSLYASRMSANEARIEVDQFLTKIHDFVEEYVLGKRNTENKTDKNGFDGVIDGIQDIEENIWLPKLGLMGKVDVSVNVRPRKDPGSLKYLPLELKTGRASFSHEHTGQLIIYQMMLSEINQSPVKSGILLYLRDGTIKEVQGSRNEHRDLIMLRNELAYYMSKEKERYAELTQLPDNKENTTELTMESVFNKIINKPELPEPINHPSACRNCPYNIICSLYLNKNPEMKGSLKSSHVLREISDLVTVHLKQEHIEYFCRWVGILALEGQEGRKTHLVKNLWTQKPETRHKRKHAVINLKLDQPVVTESDDAFVHEFKTKETEDLLTSGINVGDYLIVSTNDRISVAAGRVVSIEMHAIKMCLERDLSIRYANNTFILDKYESQTINSFNIANLGALLGDTEATESLRKTIIDRTKPTFTKQLPKIIATEGKEILKGLNKVQRSAVLKALTANDYLLLKGLPGTGKTQTVIAIIRLLVLMGKSILISSHTHSAVDNVLSRLRKTDPNVRFMRLGSRQRIKQELEDCSERTLTEHCQTSDELKAVYTSFNVVGVTCLGASHPLLTQKVFDICLVDESTQVFQPTILRPLFSAKKFILIGDPDQLPPIIRSSEARSLGADESLFARLDSQEATVALTMQYRMNRSITKLANDLTYGGALTCADDQVALGTLKLSKQTEIKWLQRLLSSHIEQAACFLNTGNVYERCIQFLDTISGDVKLAEKLNLLHLTAKASAQNEAIKENPKKSVRLYTNYCEAALILVIIRELIDAGIIASTIGVIAPYVLQVELLKQIIHKNVGVDIEVNTVDQYQGRDKEVIIYSCTKTGNFEKHPNSNGFKNKIEILEDHRRLTVAITRAKHKLIMVGDVKALDIYSPFKIMLKGMSGMNKITLSDGHHGFSWTDTLAVLK